MGFMMTNENQIKSVTGALGMLTSPCYISSNGFHLDPFVRGVKVTKLHNVVDCLPLSKYI